MISHELPLKEEVGTLFQQYFNEESLVLAAAMLHDNNIVYRIKVNNSERKKFGNLIHEIHINENELEKANKLLAENENIYNDTLIKIELKKRGVELMPPEEGATGVVQLFIVLFIFLLVQFLLGIFK